MAESASDISHLMQQLQQSSSAQPLPETTAANGLLPNGKKTKGRVKIKMEYIGNKLRRYTTFSKRKTGIMKKAYELSTLTGTQVMLLVASETGHVYTYATKKLQPMIASEAGKSLIQTCLNTPGEGTDLQPSRTEFTFETGSSPANPRKRKMNDNFDPTTASIASFLPTMVTTPLFRDFNEDDYNQAADSGDESESEEPSDGGKEESQAEETPLKHASAAPSAIDTIREALKAAANNKRQQQQQRSRATPTMPSKAAVNNAFLAPFLLSGGAAANGVFMNAARGADEATAPNSLLSLPFALNLQQLMESAALGAQITNSE